MMIFRTFQTAHRYLLNACMGCVAGMLILTATGQSSATTMVAANLATLSEAAENAFIVRIESVDTTSTDQGQSYDIISGTVVEPVFGDHKTSETISWKQFRLSQGVMLPSMPVYEAGSEYLIFLTGKGPGTGYQAPVGLGQGTFKITRNPQTGAAIARNAYMNSSLLLGLNVDAVAEDIVNGDATKRAMPPQQKEAEINKVKASLRGRGSQGLDTLKSAARFFHKQKKEGRNPSLDYRTTGPVQVIK